MPTVAPTPITALPAAPDPNDRATFNTRAYPWAAAQAVMVAETNALAGNVYDNAVIAEASASAAESSATTAVAAANFKGNWSALTGALAIPASVAHGGAVYILLANVANVALEVPGVSSAWMLLSPINQLPILSSLAASKNAVSAMELLENANVSVGAAIQGICYGAGLFVAYAVGASNYVYTSTDCKVWTARTMPSSAVWRVAFGNGVFVACVPGTTTTAKSADALTWSAGGALPATASADAVPLYLTVGATDVWLVDTSASATAYSQNNGTNWGVNNLPSSRGAGRIIGSGELCLYWESGTAYRVAAGFSSWNSGVLPFTPVSAFNAIQDFDGAILACNQTAGSPIYRTTNGTTWVDTGRVYGEFACTINGVQASFGATLGEAMSWHNGKSMIRRSKGALVAPNHTKQIATNGAGIFAIPSSLSNCITRIAPGEADAAKAAFM